MVRIVNLTPHAVVLHGEDGKKVEIAPAAGRPARRKEVRTAARPIAFGGATVPVARISYGEIEDLPDPVEGTVYIVSLPVAQAVGGRDDVLMPDDLVRDAGGWVVGCRALACL